MCLLRPHVYEFVSECEGNQRVALSRQAEGKERTQKLCQQCIQIFELKLIWAWAWARREQKLELAGQEGKAPEAQPNVMNLELFMLKATRGTKPNKLKLGFEEKGQKSNCNKC